MDKEPVNSNADNKHYEALEHAKINKLRAMLVTKNHFYFL